MLVAALRTLPRARCLLSGRPAPLVAPLHARMLCDKAKEVSTPEEPKKQEQSQRLHTGTGDLMHHLKPYQKYYVMFSREYRYLSDVPDAIPYTVSHRQFAKARIWWNALIFLFAHIVLFALVIYFKYYMD